MSINISAKWRQDYKEPEFYDDTMERKALEKSVWNDLDLSDLWNYSRNHALLLFASKTPVIVKEGKTYICNDITVANDLRKKHKGSKIVMFLEVENSDLMLKNVGFLSNCVVEFNF